MVVESHKLQLLYRWRRKTMLGTSAKSSHCLSSPEWTSHYSLYHCWWSDDVKKLSECLFFGLYRPGSGWESNSWYRVPLFSESVTDTSSFTLLNVAPIVISVLGMWLPPEGENKVNFCYFKWRGEGFVLKPLLLRCLEGTKGFFRYLTHWLTNLLSNFPNQYLWDGSPKCAFYVIHSVDWGRPC